MVDKGFLIQDLLKVKNVGFVIFLFLGVKMKILKNEVFMIYNIVCLRIYVEWVNRRVKGILYF